MVNTVLQTVGLSMYEVLGIGTGFFLGGFSLGYLVGKEFSEDVDENMRQKIALLIAGIWAISVVATIVVPSYQTSIWIHAIMGGIVGYLFGIDDPVSGLFGGQK